METSDHSGSRIQRKSVLTPTSRRSIQSFATSTS
jgi:hypothetical protein